MGTGWTRPLAVAAAAACALAGIFAPRAAEAREVVRINVSAEPGTIIIRNSERRLYLVQNNGTAIRYRVAVGRQSEQWEGRTVINGRHVRPAWSPPAVVRRANPNLPDIIPGGAPNNPMGEGALTLAGGEYAIHGTSASMRRSVGTAASFGCFRMLNEDVVDLMNRVGVGAPVMVTR
ncbi:MAG: ErfK/YbiS/YcfS/YnhG family protein [Xanthobacteraceae bacterium]|nr:MAG: ErfK/YbiS/YcfS/YnhG family protein [Xanthobacteraceae bacterium]